MIMPPPSLEERVASLEKQVAHLQSQNANKPGRNDWQNTVGIFTDNPGMLEIFAEAMKIREADRAKARRKLRKPKRAKT
jgi:hypothetical protein